MSHYASTPAAHPPGPPTAPPGWYPDPAGGGSRYWDGWSWHAQTAEAVVWPAYPATHAEDAADRLAGGIATYERVSGALWIVLGLVQILSVVLIVAGVWNIIVGISRLAGAGRIQRREAGVPKMFEGIVGLILIGLVNLFFGAVVGVLLVGVDFYVRQRVLDNRHIFTR